MCIFKQRRKEIASFVNKDKSSILAVEKESPCREWWLYLEAQSPALTAGAISC